MKLLLLHQFFVLDGEPGGTRHISLARFFQRQGIEVHVIAGSVNYMTGKSRLPFFKLWKREQVHGISITWISCFPTLRYGIAGKLLCYFSFFVNALAFVFLTKGDLVLATFPPPFVALLGWLASRWRKVPWIFEVRDLWPEMIQDAGYRPGFFLGCFKQIMDFLYREASFLVPLTWGIERCLKEKGILPSKIQTIPNGVDPIFLQDNQEVAYHPLKGQGKFRVVYLGAMGLANQVSRVLDLAEELQEEKQIEFVLIGDGTEKNKLSERAARENLVNVRFLGAVPRSQVPAYLKTADLCMTTSMLRDSFGILLPNRIFDYMASGKPVLLWLSKGDASLLLQAAGGGIQVNPDDLQSAKECVLSFFKNPEKAKIFGQANRDYVLRHFLREQLAEKYIEVFRLVMGTGPFKI